MAEVTDYSTRITKAYTKELTFTPSDGDDAGKKIEYTRLAIVFSVGGKPYEILAKVTKDQRAIIDLADEVREPVEV